MIPPLFCPTNPSDGERKIFDLLRDDPLTNSWTVLHSQDIAQHIKQVVGEADFVVLIPGKGVLCLEVKGHRRVRREGGAWFLGRGDPDYRGPFKQAAEASNSILKRVKMRSQAFGKTPFTWAVVFPFVAAVERFATDEWQPWQLVTADNLQHATIGKILGDIIDAERRRLTEVETARWFQLEVNALTFAERDALADLLRPDFELCETSRSAKKRRAEELHHYTEEQFGALDAMEVNEHVIFEGPAGTGKTVLALEAARREAVAGRRVLLLCFNKLLADWLREEVRSFGVPVTVRTLHSLLCEITKENASNPDSSDFWERELPNRALEMLLDDDAKWEFDVLIIDEAQDILRESYLDVLECMVRNGWHGGRWRMFGDFAFQAIYDNPDWGLAELQRRAPFTARYSLRINCRNTPRIIEFVNLLARPIPGYSRALRPNTGSDPTVRYFSNKRQVQVLAESLNELLDDGFTESEIVVLSAVVDSCALEAAQTTLSGVLTPLSTRLPAGKVGYSTVHAFKGLDRPAVVLTDVEDIVSERARMLFYTAISRATDRLIILVNERAKPQVIDVIRKKVAANDG